jgi:hypothetical protein
MEDIMKKTIAILMAVLALAFSLAACNPTGSSKNNVSGGNVSGGNGLGALAPIVSSGNGN